MSPGQRHAWRRQEKLEAGEVQAAAGMLQLGWKNPGKLFSAG